MSKQEKKTRWEKRDAPCAATTDFVSAQLGVKKNNQETETVSPQVSLSASMQYPTTTYDAPQSFPLTTCDERVRTPESLFIQVRIKFTYQQQQHSE